LDHFSNDPTLYQSQADATSVEARDSRLERDINCLDHLSP